jgi:hypothetical protein
VANKINATVNKMSLEIRKDRRKMIQLVLFNDLDKVEESLTVLRIRTERLKVC